MAAEDRDYNLTEEQKAVKAKYPPLCKKYECEYFLILLYLILVHCGCDSAVVRARVIAGNRETRNQCSSSCFSCNLKKNHDGNKLLKSHLENFSSSGPFLSNFSTSHAGGDIQKCAGVVCGVFPLLKDDHFCLSPPLQCLLINVGGSPRVSFRQGTISCLFSMSPEPVWRGCVCHLG